MNIRWFGTKTYHITSCKTLSLSKTAWAENIFPLVTAFSINSCKRKSTVQNEVAVVVPF